MAKESTRFVMRPKVRFSQALDSEEEGKCAGEDAPSRSTGPKIRSVVNFDKKVKILNLGDRPEKIAKDVISVEENTKDVIALPPCKAASKDDQKPLNDAANGQNIAANLEKNDDKLKPSESPLPVKEKNITSPLMLPVAQTALCANNVAEPQKNTTGSKSIESVRSKRGKENEEMAVKKNTKGLRKKSADRSTVQKSVPQQRAKSSTRCSDKKGSDLKNIETKSDPVITIARSRVKPLRASSSSKQNKRLIIKPKVGVMPCHKHKHDFKAKASPVKKTVIRDIVGHKVRPYIGPGIVHKKQEQFRKPEITEAAQTKVVTSGEKLARPEYNSIMCTINKLKEVQEEKIVTDIEHLPAAYKNMVNGKVSAALNFPLDEAIYKNLVDLSIDENQLPGRLVRSKDPEPRQKDITPQLSDFFTPAPTDEYCDAVSINPRTPEIIDCWSAYRISDKIIEWKQSLDNEQ